MNEEKEKKSSETELLEDTPVRFLGYFGRLGRIAGRIAIRGSRYVSKGSKVMSKGSRFVVLSRDVGESVKPVVDPKVVWLGHGISFAYIAVDVGLHGYNAYKNGKDYKRAAIQQFSFQMLGSILFPSVFIHGGIHISSMTVSKMKSPYIQRWAPVVTGLALLPLMPIYVDEPVEEFVHWVFDRVWPELDS